MDVSEAAALARRMWVRFETYHGVIYGAPEARAATDALGAKGGWMSYFALRSAPLGEASPELITAVFYNFHPTMVRRALPDAWTAAPASAYLEARLTGADAALARMLGDDVRTSDDIAEAAALAATAVAAVPTAGRPLGAANAVLPTPDRPHLALWQAATTLRESRGDGHVAALVAAGLDPCEALVMFGADHGLDPVYLRAARKWSEPEWQAAAERLAGRGLLTESRQLTDSGRELRAWVEDRTDRAAAAPWVTLGTAGADRFTELMTPIALRIARANEALRVNPMALNAERELSR
ncbi:MAG TPA: hypothetical protein VHF06_30955 [Pseudonocardiaceae bacterium]|jgi:hypothetical protein|nr:hypothetical protein [Pseudonocardiaceae bacterium]